VRGVRSIPHRQSRGRHRHLAMRQHPAGLALSASRGEREQHPVRVAGGSDQRLAHLVGANGSSPPSSAPPVTVPAADPRRPEGPDRERIFLLQGRLDLALRSVEVSPAKTVLKELIASIEVEDRRLVRPHFRIRARFEHGQEWQPHRGIVRTPWRWSKGHQSC
jgi:hypothetical protein